ncbi:MAG TPA: hypothetical protein VM261_38410 [Kofleriaceae bacterium]|nr:hypothetical protein [Kofleriaceae bacterium]
MRKLATIALLALSLFTVACTESEDMDADIEAASVDEPSLGDLDPSSDTFSERAPADSPQDDRLQRLPARPAHAGSDQPIVDRLGEAGRPADRLSGQPATGTAECFTKGKLSAGEPVVGAVTMAPDEVGAVARTRYDHLTKIRGLR